MKPSEKRARVRLIQKVQKESLLAVFEQQQINKLKRMADLVLENQKIQHYPLACFMYEGLWYTYPYNYEMPLSTKGIPRLLHHSLLAKASKIMDPGTFDEIEVKIHIRACLGHVLSACRTVRDLREILPTALYPKMTVEETVLFNIGDELTLDEKATLETRTKKGMDALRIVYMTELLLAKVED